MPSQTFLNLPEEKQERILTAAVKEFGQRNVREANLSNIISDAGISRGSIYQYFSNKDDLYVYVFDTLRARRAEFVKPAFAVYKKLPFIRFFEEFYLLDSEYLLRNPSHIELGKQLYSYAHGVSRGLIQRLQNHYKEIFIVGIEVDKEKGLISEKINTSSLAGLCVHFVTDIFIFQSVTNQLSMANLREYIRETLFILENGMAPRNP